MAPEDVMKPDEDLIPKPAAPVYCSFCGKDVTRSFLVCMPKDPSLPNVLPEARVCVNCLEDAILTIVDEAVEIRADLGKALQSMSDLNEAYAAVQLASMNRELRRAR